MASQLANAIRFLSADAVQQANSGHPGAPMGMADMAEVLWRGFLKHNPANPKFYNRDRFILSNGHASMLLYSLLHLTGYNVTINDLKNFRQFHSQSRRDFNGSDILCRGVFIMTKCNSLFFRINH